MARAKRSKKNKRNQIISDTFILFDRQYWQMSYIFIPLIFRHLLKILVTHKRREKDSTATFLHFTFTPIPIVYRSLNKGMKRLKNNPWWLYRFPFIFFFLLLQGCGWIPDIVETWARRLKNFQRRESKLRGRIFLYVKIGYGIVTFCVVLNKMKRSARLFLTRT